MEVVRRTSARVLLTDGQGRVLLLRGCDPARPEAGRWWFTPGGGLDEGESAEEGARRELREETGLAVADLAGPVLERDCEFDFLDRHFVVHELYFTASVDDVVVDTSGFEDYEAASIDEHRWWSAEELRATTDVVYPETLLDLLAEPHAATG